jgi:hypothetical protein
MLVYQGQQQLYNKDFTVNYIMHSIALHMRFNGKGNQNNFPSGKRKKYRWNWNCKFNLSLNISLMYMKRVVIKHGQKFNFIVAIM